MNSAPAVVGLGEALLRLSAPGHRRLDRVDTLEVDIGGAEMNTLIGVAALGGRATWVTRLPDSPLGRRISGHASAYGVELVVGWNPDARAPLYFVEHGVPPRPSEVLYDRDDTPMRRLAANDFDWPAIVNATDAAYCTGITCALGDGPRAAVAAFLQAARGLGKQTAFDLNYRGKLWSWQQAVACLRELLPDVSILFASAHDLHVLFDSPDADPVDLARGVIKEFGPRLVVVRETATVAGCELTSTVTAVTDADVVSGGTYESFMVDAFGAGDAASAAFLTLWLRGETLSEACDAAAWACAFQHTIPGDAWQVRAADLTGRAAPLRRILR